jgi:hypothetical protein
MNAIDERPALYGFFYEEAFTSPRQAADTRGQMAEFAARWGYRLAKVFTEKPGEAPAAFEALREAVRRDCAAVVVPNVDHLKPYGDVLELVSELQRSSGHHVMRSESEDI